MRPLTVGMACLAKFGGSSVVACELAQGLVQRGHRVHLFTGGAPQRLLPETPGLTAHYVKPPDYPSLEYADYTAALTAALVRGVQQQGIDLLHMHYAMPHAISAYLAQQLLGESSPRSIISLHGTDITHLAHDRDYGPLLRFAIDQADALTVPSTFLAHEAHGARHRDGGARHPENGARHRDDGARHPENGARHRNGGARHPENGARHLHVIANFVDTEVFAPAAQRDERHFDRFFATPQRGPVLVHVSNFRPIKRVPDLLPMLARLRQHVPARLVLIGDGPERDVAESLALQCGVAPHVAFLGAQHDFASHLRQADAFVLPSHSESFGMAALEALSCGVPVFAYQVGGLPEVVPDTVGTLVPAHNIDALADALGAALRAPHILATMGRAARTRVLTHYQRQPALLRYEALYERVLGAAERSS